MIRQELTDHISLHCLSLTAQSMKQMALTLEMMHGPSVTEARTTSIQEGPIIKEGPSSQTDKLPYVIEDWSLDERLRQFMIAHSVILAFLIGQSARARFERGISRLSGHTSEQDEWSSVDKLTQVLFFCSGAS